MSACVFCDILAGDLAASVVHDDATVVAFMDINPVTPGHLLVVPKKHLPAVSDMDEATGMHLFQVAMRLDRSLRCSGLRCEGVNLFLADGAVAGQEVFHVHLHVFPRFAGDTFRTSADWSLHPSRADLDHIAEQIRQAYINCWPTA